MLKLLRTGYLETNRWKLLAVGGSAGAFGARGYEPPTSGPGLSLHLSGTPAGARTASLSHAISGNGGRRGGRARTSTR